MAHPPMSGGPGKNTTREERGAGNAVAQFPHSPYPFENDPSAYMAGNQQNAMAMAAAYHQHQHQQQMAYWYYMYANAMQAYHMHDRNHNTDRTNAAVPVRNVTEAGPPAPTEVRKPDQPRILQSTLQKPKPAPTALKSGLPNATPKAKKDFYSAITLQMKHVSPKKRERERSPEMGENGTSKKVKPGQEVKVCNNCGTTDTPFWRKEKTGGMPLCNACGLYCAKNDAPRPKLLWRRPSTPPKLSA